MFVIRTEVQLYKNTSNPMLSCRIPEPPISNRKSLYLLKAMFLGAILQKYIYLSKQLQSQCGTAYSTSET